MIFDGTIPFILGVCTGAVGMYLYCVILMKAFEGE